MAYGERQLGIDIKKKDIGIDIKKKDT